VESRPKLEQGVLFDEPARKPRQEELKLDVSGISDEQSWDAAENHIYDALRRYAEQAENGGGFQRRPFAEDAARGFAFIDLCCKHYDLVLMNPPYGLASQTSDSLVRTTIREPAMICMGHL
jgi:hypothetical protein